MEAIVYIAIVGNNSDVHHYNTRNRANLQMVKITSNLATGHLPTQLLNYFTTLIMPRNAP